MKYMGSKNRIAKHILPFIKEYLNGDNWFVDAFCGGCNLIDKLDYPKRIANDSNKYLIELFKIIQICEITDFKYVTKDEYERIRDNKNKYSDHRVGHAGFVCSFNGKFFNGFSGITQTKEGIRNYQDEALRSLFKSKPKLNGVRFSDGDYKKVVMYQGLENSVIYCDPPYANTTGYKGSNFNHDEFWQWCRDMTAQGHKVFVSEYHAPEDFKCVWEMKVTNSLNTTKTYKPIEKLFTI